MTVGDIKTWNYCLLTKEKTKPTFLQLGRGGVDNMGGLRLIFSDSSLEMQRQQNIKDTENRSYQTLTHAKLTTYLMSLDYVFELIGLLLLHIRHNVHNRSSQSVVLQERTTFVLTSYKRHWHRVPINDTDHYLNKSLLNSHKHLHISVHSGWVLQIKPPPEETHSNPSYKWLA